MNLLTEDDVIRISMMVLCDAPDEDDVRLIRAIEAKILEIQALQKLTDAHQEIEQDKEKS